MAFTVIRHTPLVPEVAWSAVADLAQQTRDVPLTTMEVPPGGLVLGSEVVAWTRLGPLGFADRMLLTGLEPGRRLRLVKTGRVPSRLGGHRRRRRPRRARRGAGHVDRGARGCAGSAASPSPVGDRLGPRLFGGILDGVLQRAAADAVRPVRGSDP